MTALWVLAGTIVCLTVLLDVWVTILHPDAEGLIASAVRRGVWAMSARRGLRLPLVLAGPVLVTMTFLAWLVPLILGVALVTRPGIEDYRTADGVSAGGFADAVYYAGTTLSVLGYGDITPAGTGPRIQAAAAALLAAHSARTRALRVRAEELASALLRTQDTIADRYLDLRPAGSSGVEQGGEEELHRLWSRLRPVIGGPAGDRPPADDLAAQVQRRSIACLEALRGWSPPRVDVAAPRTGTGEEHETPTP